MKNVYKYRGKKLHNTLIFSKLNNILKQEHHLYKLGFSHMDTVKNEGFAPKIKEVKKFVLSVIPTQNEIPQEKIKTSHEGYRVLRQIHLREGNDIQEFFYVLFLNRANVATGYYFASMGGTCATIADPKLIVKAVALSNCSSILLCHNHPSGNLQPSKADEELTIKLKSALSFFDIKILDHIILSEDESYYSFADNGLM